MAIVRSLRDRIDVMDRKARRTETDLQNAVTKLRRGGTRNPTVHHVVSSAEHEAIHAALCTRVAPKPPRPVGACKAKFKDKTESGSLTSTVAVPAGYILVICNIPDQCQNSSTLNVGSAVPGEYYYTSNYRNGPLVYWLIPNPTGTNVCQDAAFNTVSFNDNSQLLNDALTTLGTAEPVAYQPPVYPPWLDADPREVVYPMDNASSTVQIGINAGPATDATAFQLLANADTCFIFPRNRLHQVTGGSVEIDISVPFNGLALSSSIGPGSHPRLYGLYSDANYELGTDDQTIIWTKVITDNFSAIANLDLEDSWTSDRPNTLFLPDQNLFNVSAIELLGRLGKVNQHRALSSYTYRIPLANNLHGYVRSGTVGAKLDQLRSKEPPTGTDISMGNADYVGFDNTGAVSARFGLFPEANLYSHILHGRGFTMIYNPGADPLSVTMRAEVEYAISLPPESVLYPSAAHATEFASSIQGFPASPAFFPTDKRPGDMAMALAHCDSTAKSDPAFAEFRSRMARLGPLLSAERKWGILNSSTPTLSETTIKPRVEFSSFVKAAKPIAEMLGDSSSALGKVVSLGTDLPVVGPAINAVSKFAGPILNGLESAAPFIEGFASLFP